MWLLASATHFQCPLAKPSYQATTLPMVGVLALGREKVSEVSCYALKHNSLSTSLDPSHLSLSQLLQELLVNNARCEQPGSGTGRIRCCMHGYG